MKKLFAILMVLTLVAGASFAQVSVFGGAHSTVELLMGNGDGEIYGTGVVGQARIGLSGENEAGTFGAMVRVDFNGNFPAGADLSEALFDYEGAPNFLLGNNVRANVWWKPIDQLKILLGQPGDGWWGKRNVTGWGFNEAANDTVAIERWNYGAFYDGTTGDINGLHLEIKPVDFIGVNIMLPFYSNYYDYDAGEGKIIRFHDELGDIFKSMHAQVDLNLAFGNIAISYIGGGDFDYIAGTMYVSAGLGMIPNVDLHIGARMTLPGTYTEFSDYPIAIGVGANISIGDRFGVKARLETDIVDGYFGLKFGVLPSFALNDRFKIFAQIGLEMGKADGSDAVTRFILNPYIRIDGGPGAFWAGFKMVADNQANSDAVWSVPIGITFSF